MKVLVRLTVVASGERGEIYGWGFGMGWVFWCIIVAVGRVDDLEQLELLLWVGSSESDMVSTSTRVSRLDLGHEGRVGSDLDQFEGFWVNVLSLGVIRAA
ncbi:Hypothetical predicted protein [Olea europaea subsp. europaea]|uniref:Uncharacterized protein n=1 Tax=Olea europaea subsp. europaea TaxID=158383 RepID=A0A8S0P6U8_OLEEU|nr:Hypothetical predicted protein [Olea europaea subsp. europaea]